MKKPVIVEPKELFEAECLKRIIEGLKLAASCATEMQEIAPKAGWGRIKEALYHMASNCKKLASAKPITRQALLQGVDIIQKTHSD